LGQRERKRRRVDDDFAKKRRAASAPAPPAPERRLRGEARDAAVRAELKPYAPGERPPTIVISVATAAGLALANVIAFAAGIRVRGQENQVTGVVIFGTLMLVTAWGMWNLRYWAVLGFQALLAITILVSALSLMVASNIAAVALSGGIVLFGGWLFWKLVRTMARIQLPQR
jgi:hypothetical protein